MILHFRQASESDLPLLGKLNHELIQDEKHRNPMTVPQLEERMRGWLGGEYTAIFFEQDKKVVAYALYQETADKIYLRQLFVQRTCRRKGYGRQAFHLLRTKIWPLDKRLTVDVLTSNHVAIAFWKAVGFREYALTLEILPPVS